MTPPVLNPTETPSLTAALTAVLDHIRRCELPEPASLSVNHSSVVVEMQPHHADPAAVAVELIGWSESLTSTVIELVALGSGPVHLHLTGCTGSGQAVKFFTTPPVWLHTQHQDVLDEHGRVLLAPLVLRNWMVTESGVIA